MKKFVKMLSLVCLLLMAPILMFGCKEKANGNIDDDIKMNYITYAKYDYQSGGNGFYFEIEINNNNSKDAIIWVNNFNVELVYNSETYESDHKDYSTNISFTIYTSRNENIYSDAVNANDYFTVGANSKSTIYVCVKNMSTMKTLVDADGRNHSYYIKNANISYNANQIASIYLFD